MLFGRMGFWVYRLGMRSPGAARRGFYLLAYEVLRKISKCTSSTSTRLAS